MALVIASRSLLWQTTYPPSTSWYFVVLGRSISTHSFGYWASISASVRYCPPIAHLRHPVRMSPPFCPTPGRRGNRPRGQGRRNSRPIFARHPSESSRAPNPPPAVRVARTPHRPDHADGRVHRVP